MEVMEMSVDELTDKAFFELYQGNPQIKQLVDGIQMKYRVHSSQKGQPGYNEKNISTATKEAKETVSHIIQQQKHGHGETHNADSHKNPESHGFKLPQFTGTQAAFGLGLAFLVVAALSIYAPISIPAIAYSAPMYGL